MRTSREKSPINFPLITQSNEKPDLGKEYWSKRRARQDKDAQLKALENRVNMLKNQENDLWKKIGRGEKDAVKVIKVKQLNKQFHDKRSMLRAGSDNTLALVQAMHQERRGFQNEYNHSQVRAILEQYHQNYTKIKKESIKHDQSIILQKHEITSKKQQSTCSVKESLLQATVKLQDQKNQKQDFFRKDYLKRIRGEEVLTHENNKRFQQLEHTESRLLEKLQNTRALSQNVETQVNQLKGTASVDILTKLDDIKSMYQVIKTTKKKFLASQSIDDSKYLKNLDESSIYQQANLETSAYISETRRKKKKKSKKKKQKPLQILL